MGRIGDADLNKHESEWLLMRQGSSRGDRGFGSSEKSSFNGDFFTDALCFARCKGAASE